MYELNPVWREYYLEYEPSRRRELLDRIELMHPDDGANAYREALFRIRHTTDAKPGSAVDRMLFQCVSFIQVYRSARLFRKSAVRETQKTCKEFLFPQASEYGPAGECALYWELRNAAARYFRSCLSPDYGRALFGVMKSSEGGRLERMCQDAWEMSEGLAARVSMQDELKIWCAAVRDSFFAADPKAEELWRKRETDSSKRGS